MHLKASTRHRVADPCGAEYVTSGVCVHKFVHISNTLKDNENRFKHNLWLRKRGSDRPQNAQGVLAVVEIAAPGEWMLRAVFTWMLYSTIVIAVDRRFSSDLRYLSYAKKDVGHQVTQRQRKHVMTAFGSVSACDRRVSMRSLRQFGFRLHRWIGPASSVEVMHV